MKLAKVSADGARWTIQHEFLSMNQKLLASITVDGGWIDTRLRKFAATTPHIVKEVFDRVPRSASFTES
jgi:acyl-CoA thioester hydrolase